MAPVTLPIVVMVVKQKISDLRMLCVGLCKVIMTLLGLLTSLLIFMLGVVSLQDIMFCAWFLCQISCQTEA